MPFVSIHAPHARGDEVEIEVKDGASFQFTPLMRGATRRCFVFALTSLFQFTPLMRGATDVLDERDTGAVSIHAPHARGDFSK